jgi:putative ABC transport system permease protein
MMSAAMLAAIFADALQQDIRYAIRSLRRSPGFVATAIAALALGIGANTAVFSVVNTVLLQPLSYPDPDALVQFGLVTAEGRGATVSIPEFAACRAQQRILQDVAAYDFGGPGINLTDGDRPEQVQGLHVSRDYFRLFGAQIARGRTFTNSEDRPAGDKVVVISDALWRRRFNADPNLVGKSLSLGNEPYLLIGVLGPKFAPDPPADLWLPLQADPGSRSMAHYLRVAARLKPGVTVEGANAQLQSAAAEFRRAFPLFNAQAGFSVWPLRDTAVTDVRKALLLLLGTVAMVLLIACANVGNLLLARATGRRREIAIRAALGASRRRIVVQLLTESLVLSVFGGLFGLLAGYAGIRGLLLLNPGNIPRLGAGLPVPLDWRVLAFTAAISLATGLVFGLVPALNASRAGLNTRAGSGLRDNRARSIFVVLEVALALILLIGAALLIRTFGALHAVQPGFDSRHVLTLEMSLTGTRFQKTAGVAQVVREAERRVGALPGVLAVASTWMLPVENAFSSSFVIEGRPLPAGPVHGQALMRPVSSQFFEVFRIPLRRGRWFTDRDSGASAGVVLISEGMAKKFWPGANPLGERLSVDKYHPEFAAPPRQIIGIVGDVRNFGMNREPDPAIYFPQSQVADGMTAIDAQILPITWVVRTQAESSALTSAIREQLRQASGGFPVSHVRSMEQVLGQSMARSDFNTVLLTVFAGIALLLAAIGVYGLMNDSVQQRSQEIGVRMALGATPRQVRSLVVRAGMRLAILGVGVGLAAAFALARVMDSLLYGVKSSDSLAFASVSGLLLLVALLAAYIPSRRATRIDPIQALRTP